MAEAHEAVWQEEAAADEQQLRQRLLRRIGLAGVLIVALVASLAMFDAVFVHTPNHESQDPSAVTVNTEPVPAAETPATESSDQAVAEPDVGAAADTPAAAEAVPPLADKPQPETRPEDRPEAPSSSAAPKSAAGIKPITRAEPRLDPRPLPVVPEGTATPTLPQPPQPVVRPTPPVAPVAPVVRSTRPLTPGQGYLVQLGVFSNIANAEELKGRLDKAGIPAHIEARVQVGPFKNKVEAEAAQKKLAQMGLSGLLLSPRK